MVSEHLWCSVIQKKEKKKEAEEKGGGGESRRKQGKREGERGTLG